MPLLPKRVILASDSSPNYIQFWPYVARHWKQVHGITPTLFYISGKVEEDKQKIDTECGQVVFVEALPGIPHGLQAQLIRLLAPAMYPNDVCVICDIDLFLLKADFFTSYGLGQFPDSLFASLNRYMKDRVKHLSLSYQVAKGSTFGQVFQCDGNLEHMRQRIAEWCKSKDYAWSRDEMIMLQYLKPWGKVNPGRWRVIQTPGIWGARLATRSVTRFFNCFYDPSKAATLQELEPLRPLLSVAGFPTVKRVLAACNPKFVLPEAVHVFQGYFNHQGPSRHPLEKGKLLSVPLIEGGGGETQQQPRPVIMQLRVANARRK